MISLPGCQENIARHEARFGPVDGGGPNEPMH